MFYRVTKDINSESTVHRLYLFEFKDESGYYIKCGKSSGSSSVNRLFSILEDYIKVYKTECPYIKILRDVEVTHVFEREKEFHTMFQERRHYPLYSFSGHTELFKITKEEALAAFDKVTGIEFNRGTTKICKKCGIEKPTFEFYSAKNKTDNLRAVCKACVLEQQRSFSKLPIRIYNNQILHSKQRGHPSPVYTYTDFEEWILANKDYNALYKIYEDNNYAAEYVPSVDRIDSSKPYTFDNIELVSFKENLKRHADDIINLFGNKVLVISASTGQVVAEVISQNKAADLFNLARKSIHKKVDNITKYGRLSYIGDYHIISKKNENYFIDNGFLKEEFRRTAR